MTDDGVLGHNLPLALSSFVGREEALLALGPHIRETRLALEAAQRGLPSFAGGVWLVELVPLTDPAEVVRVVAQALDVAEQSGRSLVDTLAATLRTAELLLVLDNCEHLIVAVARLAETLLCICARLHILATSREVLTLPGEIVWPISSLATPEPTASPETLRRADAVRLFSARRDGPSRFRPG